MRPIKWGVLFIYIFFGNINLTGQEQLGLRLDSHAGILGSQLNPSSLATSKLKWDINIFSAGIHFNNEYAYLRNARLLDLFGNRNIVIQDNEGSAAGANDLVLDFFDLGKPMNATALAFAQGLSGFFSIKQHRIGLSLRSRVLGDAHRIPAVFGYDAYNRLAIDSTISLNHTRMNAMTWHEVNLHYAASIMNNSDHSISVGSNLKYLMGTNAAYMSVSKNTQFTKLSDQLVSAENGNIALGAAGQLLDTTANSIFEINGQGLGFDFGFTYLKKAKKKPYQYKWGVSIIDLGFIPFNNNARSVQVNLDSLLSFDQDSFQQLNNADATFDQLIENAASVNNGITTNEQFNMGLPTALSVQFDYSLSQHIFVNAVLIQRVILGGQQSKRRNLFAVTPRIDYNWWGFQMPLSIVDYKELQWGASVRLGPLTVGSERLNTILFKQPQFTGSDIYISLKIDSFTFKKKGRDEVQCWGEMY